MSAIHLDIQHSTPLSGVEWLSLGTFDIGDYNADELFLLLPIIKIQPNTSGRKSS